MYRTHETIIGLMDDPRTYKNNLLSMGYTDLGWQNGWGDIALAHWRECKVEAHEEDYHIEDLQWNNTGSHCTYVIHELKVFCSVDMGD